MKMASESKCCRVAALGFSVLAALLAAWMGFNSLGTGQLPPGCGEGMGCAEVLTSSWARWYGIPVVWGAVLVYGLLAAGLLIRNPFLVGFTEALAVGATLWFVFLQAAVLQTFCVFCMVVHTLGAIGAVLAIAGTRPRKPPLLLGSALVIVFVGLHAVQPRPVHLLRPPAGGEIDFRAPDGRRGLALLEGRHVLDVSASPLIGNPEATQILVVLVDYACPHCRSLHHDLSAYQQQHPDDIALLVLPTSIHPDCNPLIDEAPARFQHSCEITRLALGLFHTHPERWADFDHWLFEPAQPRSLEAAKAHLSAQGLQPEALMAHPAAQADLQRNVALFADLPVDDPRERRVPALLAVGHPPLVGPAGRIDRLPHLTPATPHTPHSP